MSTRQTVQQRIMSYSVDLFAGGMDSDASPYRTTDNMAILGENVEFYRDNTLRSRQGYTLSTPVDEEDNFITQRVGGTVRRYFKEAGHYKSEANGTIDFVGPSTGKHTFLRILDGVLVVEPTGIFLIDSDGFQKGAVDTPARLSASPEGGGKLKEGIYTYTYNYLLVGGAESPQAEEVEVKVLVDDSKVTLNIPSPENHTKLFKLRLYRKDPEGGYPLLIQELPVGTTTYVDTGDSQSALLPQQGVRQMPGGNLALIHNRRLFVIDGNTLHYSYPGNYTYSNVFWTEQVNLPTGEPITAMCPLGQGIIFFGLETAIYMNNVPSEGGTFNPIPIPDGCVSQSAWTLAEDGTLLYIGKSGVYAMQGAQAQRISDPVNDKFRNYTVGELAQSTIIFDQQERRLQVGLPNEMLVYYFQTKAWSLWTLPNMKLDWFEGTIHIIYQGKFGILGDSDTDNGEAIQGKFVSGVLGMGDATIHKLFRRMGIEVSANPTDNVNLHVRALDRDTHYEGLSDRPQSGSTWDTALWDISTWGENLDTTQTVSLPDTIQGRYLQYTITFSTTNAKTFIIHGPVVFEFRARYRYGRL